MAVTLAKRGPNTSLSILRVCPPRAGFFTPNEPPPGGFCIWRQALPDSERTDIRHVSMRRLRRSVQWVGNVRLHMTGEVSESLLANCEHNGAHHYACASTGLMFDKRTGECVQASTVSLDVTSVVARECSEAQFRSWLSSKMVGDWIKMSKKGAVRRLPALFDDEDVEDSDYEDVRLELI